MTGVQTCALPIFTQNTDDYSITPINDHIAFSLERNKLADRISSRLIINYASTHVNRLKEKLANIDKALLTEDNNHVQYLLKDLFQSITCSEQLANKNRLKYKELLKQIKDAETRFNVESTSIKRYAKSEAIVAHNHLKSLFILLKKYDYDSIDNTLKSFHSALDSADRKSVV